MSAKNRIAQPRYIVAGDMSADVVGSWIRLEGLDNISFHWVTTGTPTGTWEVDVSNDDQASDYQTNVPATTLGYTTLTLPSSMTTTNPAGSASNGYFDFNQMSCRWIRFVYRKTSGSGALSVGAFGKAI